VIPSTRAIVRPPAPNFAEGLTTAGLGPPAYEMAREQHEAYCRTLERCGLELTRLEPDSAFPDSTFVEDTAVITGRGAVLTRPGAPSRRGEVELIRETLSLYFTHLHEIASPGTLDGGDVCEAGDTFFIGISHRTNEEGASQLTHILKREGFRATTIDIRPVRRLLHLKSGLAYLGEKRLLVADAIAGEQDFRGFESIRVPPDELYAANCVRLNQHILLAAGFPATVRLLEGEGYSPILLEVSEFQKMDGGLSCLSLRF
jgi:dimethylargininase